MKNHYKTVASSDITISQLMLPSHELQRKNSWRLHPLLDQIVLFAPKIPELLRNCKC
jgi:hypothetical protein